MRETIAEIGMLIENVKIKCPAKPITHAFIYFNDNDERGISTSAFDLAEQILKVRVSRWTDSGKNMSERLRQVPQVPRHRIKSRVWVRGGWQ